ncbi:MAG: MBL fold metallo-hydrolase [Christensenellales bacterium]|jgi:ribonuclease BN (tRNA processing enzyme)
MKINILGSAGWMPSYCRETACIMVRKNNTLLLLDAGTGVSNLKHFEKDLEKHDTIHIILSHYHLDHTIGLSYLSKWCKNKSIVLYLPKETKSGQSPREILEQLFNSDSFAHSLYGISKDISFFEYEEKTRFDIGDFIVETKLQTHTSPSFAIKVDDLICYASDTIIEPTTFKWASDVKIVFHECWSKEKNSSGHSSFEEILEESKKLKNGKVVLIHQNPDITLEQYEGFCEGLSKIIVAKDLMEINI